MGMPKCSAQRCVPPKRISACRRPILPQARDSGPDPSLGLMHTDHVHGGTKPFAITRQVGDLARRGFLKRRDGKAQGP